MDHQLVANLNILSTEPVVVRVVYDVYDSGAIETRKCWTKGKESLLTSSHRGSRL